MIDTIEGETMGGSWRLRLPQGCDAEPARRAVQTAFDLVDGQMSAWKPDSVLNQINRTRLGAWVELPEETAFVIRAGLGLMAEMPDTFSILMGGASARYAFQPGRVCAVSADPLAVEFDGQRLRRLVDVALDLNAIAKGYAVDLAAKALGALGCERFLVESAGDIFARGMRPDDSPWVVAMELPIPDRIVPARFIPLVDCAIATSGGYRRAKGAASHLISPATGAPLPANGASCAVLAPTTLQADGWATVMGVLGPERGLALATERSLAATFIIPDPPDGFLEAGSPAMAEWLHEEAPPGPARAEKAQLALPASDVPGDGNGAPVGTGYA